MARTTGKGASKDHAKATSTKKRKQVDQTSISDRSCVSPRPVLDPAQGDIANPTLTHQTLQAEFNNLPVSDSARPYKPDRAEATVAYKGQAPKSNDAFPIWKPSQLVQANSTASWSSSARKRKRTKSPNKTPYFEQDSGEKDDNVGESTASSRTLVIGDITALEDFMRHHLHELTIKPVQVIVTCWVKELEPKRRVQYGQYHKKLPREAPQDATPPWWPETVPYIEPTHLQKDDLFTLAIEIMLQHRDTCTDRRKREQSWTRRLQQLAEMKLSQTTSDRFTSSKDLTCHSEFKEHAESNLLPSLFNVMHSYERFMHQHRLWTYSDDMSKAPTGESITWRSLPRPQTQTGRFKRSRTVQFRVPVPGDISGEETEVDDTMTRLTIRKAMMEKFVTRLLSLADDARRMARAETTQALPVGFGTAGAVAESTLITQPMTVNQRLPPSSIEPQATSWRLGRFQKGDQHAVNLNSAPNLSEPSSEESFTRHDSSSFNNYGPPSLVSGPPHAYNNDFGDGTMYSQGCLSRRHEPFFLPPTAAQHFNQNPDYSVWTTSPPLPGQVFHGLPHHDYGAQN